MIDSSVTVVILAAGKGTRLGSSLPKVLHTVKGKPSLYHVIDLGAHFASEIVVVVGHCAKEVEEEVSGSYSDVKFALQEPQNGTGHAVSVALSQISGAYTLVLSGDVPFLSKETVLHLIDQVKTKNKSVAFVAANVADPARYGRVIVDQDGEPLAIIEAPNCSQDQLQINLINSGIYLFKTEFLKQSLPEIKRDSQKGEYYLTDLIEMGAGSGDTTIYITPNPEETAGFNTPQELEALNNRA